MWASWCLTEMNKSLSSLAAAASASKAFWVTWGSWVYSISLGVWKNCQAILMQRWWLQETANCRWEQLLLLCQGLFLRLLLLFLGVLLWGCASCIFCCLWSLKHAGMTGVYLKQGRVWSRAGCSVCICCFCLLQLFSMFGKIAEAYEIRSPKHKLLTVFNTCDLCNDSCDRKQNQSVAGMSSCCILWKPL